MQQRCQESEEVGGVVESAAIMLKTLENVFILVHNTSVLYNFVVRLISDK